MRRLGIALLFIGTAAAIGLYGIGVGWFGNRQEAGAVTLQPMPKEIVAQRVAAQAEARRRVGGGEKQILFGDFHVHTTFSWDGFLIALPALQGEGAHPPADACDFARFCSALDFWSINDHAEGLTPHQWKEIRQSIRQCNAVAGDEEDPDLVSFLGWEWTQIGLTRETHYGHKNVIIRDIEDDKTPARPIAAARDGLATDPPLLMRILLGLLAPDGKRQDYLDFALFTEDRLAFKKCPRGVDVRSLPPDCEETAATPATLYKKLRQWGYPAIVIPHGTSWGMYTPPGSSLDKQLASAQNDPELQTLIEVYSGHGNAEEYRDWRAVNLDASGKASCPEPSKDYTPSCWRAGEIIRQRCLKDGTDANICDRRATDTRRYYVEAEGAAGFLAVPGASIEDWLDAGQCRDCYLPTFNHRPAGSAQYALAIGNFDDPDNPKYFRFGFIGSSDNHKARAGTGYKEFARQNMTEATGTGTEGGPFDPQTERGPPSSTPRVVDDAFTEGRPNFQLTEVTRGNSFFTTGGLIAAHSEGRGRDAIWDALKRRETYSTSGDRILLWFDLENAPEGKLPMGSETEMNSAPRFTVRAIGAFKQKPGCPDSAKTALGEERLASLCLGECYNPSGERKRITHIEIIRIRPQIVKDEPIAPLIEDPWKRFTCPVRGNCVVSFTDPAFASSDRAAVYYARAVQEPSQVVNADNLRCSYDRDGNCVKVNPCHGDYQTPYKDDCLAESTERAWSSPIYVNYKRERDEDSGLSADAILIPETSNP